MITAREAASASSMGLNRKMSAFETKESASLAELRKRILAAAEDGGREVTVSSAPDFMMEYLAYMGYTVTRTSTKGLLVAW